MINISRDGEASTSARLLAGTHTMVLCESGEWARSGGARPEWTILLSLSGHIDGQVEWWTGTPSGPGPRSAGVIFPPQFPYVARSAGGHMGMLIDPWFQGLGPGGRTPISLDCPTADHLRALWSAVSPADLDGSARQTVAYLRGRGVLPSPITVDPRVQAALRGLSAADRVDQLAAGVGLSPSRLRALINDVTGMPPARLRMWQRLRAAMASLPDKPIALAAADAGFADQAHLTRTATRLVGQTPGELARMFRSAPSGHPRPGDSRAESGLVASPP